jgi:hypothetical protein
MQKNIPLNGKQTLLTKKHPHVSLYGLIISSIFATLSITKKGKL